MKGRLFIFAGGFVLGVITVWGLGAVRGVPGLRTSNSPVETAQGHPPLTALRSELPATASVPVNQGPPELPLQANATNVTDLTQTLLIQHLDPRLQAALKQYSSLDGNNERSGLADDVANLADDNVPVREVVEALGVMFHQERSIEVKTGILNNLLNLDDPASYELLVQGVASDQPQELRKTAIAVLGDYDDSWAVPTLQQLLSDSDAEIRQAAQDALVGKTGSTAASILIPH
jgi:HEAT repeat protein